MPDDSPLATPAPHAAPLRCVENLRVDEELLRAGRPIARVAVLVDRALSIGVGVPESAMYLTRARERGWPIVRRGSGGEAVLHAGGDLAWSLVLPRTDPRVGHDYSRAYARLGRAVVRFLAEAGIRSRWAPAPHLSESYCLLGPRGSALYVDDRVLGGAAQHVTARALLHHGILPRTLDVRALEEIFGVPRKGGLERLTSLQELGLTDSPRRLGARLAEQLTNEVASG